MSRRSSRLALAASLLMPCGCSRHESPLPAANSALPTGVVARVGEAQVVSETVALIAQRQRLSPREALARAVSEATFASAARAASPSGVASSIERAAAARAVLEQIRAQAERAGPPTQAEIAELLEERWVELARPDAVRVTHAVVINKDPRREARAREVAEKLRAAVASATSTEQFTALAKAVDAGGFDVKVEPLPPVTADGRTFEQQDGRFIALPSSYDPSFSRGAIALTQPNQVSPPIQSAFGFHVIFLQERIPGSHARPEELVPRFGSELLTRRIVRLRTELLEKLHRPGAVQVDRAVDELTARLQPSP